MSIARHVSRAMLSRYSHVRMEAKRRALETRQRTADERIHGRRDEKGWLRDRVVQARGR
jgi:hypothetical protein